MDIKSFIYMLNSATEDELLLIRNALNGIKSEKKVLSPPDYSKYSKMPWFDGLKHETIYKITTSKHMRRQWIIGILDKHIMMNINDKIEYIEYRIKDISIESENVFLNEQYKRREKVYVDNFENWKRSYYMYKENHQKQYANNIDKLMRFEEIYMGMIQQLSGFLIDIEIMIFNKEKGN